MSDYFFSSRPGFPWSVEPVGLPALALVAALLVLFTVWSYLGHPQATRRRVLAVLALRLAALLVTLLTAVRPSVGVNENPKQPSVLLVGVDASESMTVKDEIGGQARIDAVRKTLEKCQPLFDDLLNDQGVSVVLYKFGPPDFNEATGRWEPGARADAKRSDYGTYLNRTFERWQSEQRIRGHVLIGDGVDNGEHFTPLAEATRFGRRGVPLSTFLTGSESANPEAKDIAVAAIECNPSPAYIKNKVLVTARVNAYSFAGAKVTARVYLNDKPAGQDRDEFTLDRETNNELKITVDTPAERGEYKVKVEVGVEKDGKVVALPGELSPLNNWSETYLTVLKEGVRILIVDQLRWEETMLRDALRNEKRFDVYEVIRQTDLQPSESERALLDLEKNAYDVVIVGNVSAAHLAKAAPNFLQQLTDLATKKGVGVMFLGGEYAFRGVPEALLPVAGGPIIDRLNEKTGNPEVTFPTVPTPRGLEKMLRVAGKPGQPAKPSESEALWDRLNNFRTGVRFQLNGHNRLTLPPGGRFSVFAWTARLIQNGDSYSVEPSDPAAVAAGTEFDAARHEPLLVGSQRGDTNKGRWLAFGAFDTYLWRGLGQPKALDGIDMHERFWRQCVLWLAHQDEEESQVYARPQYRQMKVTQEQTVRVGMKKPDGTDDPAAPLTVKIVPLAPGAQEPKPEDLAKASAQTVIADKDGRKVLFRAPAPGEYFVLVTAPGKKGDGSPGELRGTAKFIAVPDVSDEMLRVNANADFMRQLATATGGKALRLDELPGFLKELKAEVPPDLGKKPKYYPDWHRNRSKGFLPLWLVLFVALLGAEWGLRRLWGMV
jgi:hypothetical protein